MQTHKIRNALAIAASVAFLAGCPLETTQNTAPVSGANTDGRPPSDVSGVAPSFSQFTDLPMPENSAMDLDNTWVLGSEENWTGRLVLATGSSPIMMYDFYQGEMPKFGWAKVSTVRGSRITLVYDRENRVVTIHIIADGSGSTVDMLVAPKG